MSDVKTFWDTNIFVYMYSNDQEEKRQASLSLLEKHTLFTSTQALNELCNVFTKKYNLKTSNIREFIRGITSSFHIEIIMEKTIEEGLRIKGKYGYSYYDSLMLAAALQCNCNIFFTEDMNDGQIIDGKLKIVNPYKVKEE